MACHQEAPKALLMLMLLNRTLSIVEYHKCHIWLQQRRCTLESIVVVVAWFKLSSFVCVISVGAMVLYSALQCCKRNQSECRVHCICDTQTEYRPHLMQPHI